MNRYETHLFNKYFTLQGCINDFFLFLGRSWRNKEKREIEAAPVEWEARDLPDEDCDQCSHCHFVTWFVSFNRIYNREDDTCKCQFNEIMKTV